MWTLVEEVGCSISMQCCIEIEQHRIRKTTGPQTHNAEQQQLRDKLDFGLFPRTKKYT